jgi:hypothetical protein
MKRLLSGLLCLVAPFANALQVSGQGATFEEAKLNAFRTAIEIVAGSVVTTERESVNYKLVKDEILVYSAGYVTDYKIINTFKSGNQIQIIVDVQVSSSKLSDRILGLGKEVKNFEANKHSNQYQTYLYGKNNGDRLLNQVLNDYPKKAYKLTQGVHQFKVDAYRNGIIEIPLELSWNHNFIVSFNEALGILEDGSNGLFKHSPGNITVMAKDPKDWVVGTKNQYKFNDVVIVSNVRNTLQQKKPNILLTVKNFENKNVLQQCYVPDSVAGKKAAFYDVGSTLVFYGNRVEKNKIELSVTNMQDAIKQIQSIELSIVSDDNCP